MKKKCEGKCPVCGSDNITYGDSVLEDTSLGYEFICNACHTEAIEWFDLVYSQTTAWVDEEDEEES